MITLASSFLMLLLHKSYEPTPITIIIEGDVHGDVILKGNGLVHTKSTSHTSQVKKKRNSVSSMKKGVECEDQEENLASNDGKPNKAWLEDVAASLTLHEGTSEKPHYSEDGNEDNENETDAYNNFEHINTSKFPLAGKELIAAEPHDSKDKVDIKNVLKEKDELSDQDGSININPDNRLQSVNTTRLAMSLTRAVDETITKTDCSENNLDPSFSFSMNTSKKTNGGKKSNPAASTNWGHKCKDPTIYTQDPVQSEQHPAIPQLRKEESSKCEREEHDKAPSSEPDKNKLREVSERISRNQQLQRYEKLHFQINRI